MSLFIAIGSNIGDRLKNLELAQNYLEKNFHKIAYSRIYESTAVDYIDQPDFYNQVLEYQLPNLSPTDIMNKLLSIENEMGRIRKTNKGPRLIDLDILFINDLNIQTEHLTIPHPRLFDRSFVVLPLSELPGFSDLQKKFSFNMIFNNSARPISI